MSLAPGQTVLDLGCGAGTDLLVAAQMVGPDGRVIGVDMTSAMLKHVREEREPRWDSRTSSCTSR